MTTHHTFPLPLLAALLALSAGLARADTAVRSPENKLYRAECGSCHVAYPPALLPATSWQAIMAGLDRHFGTDASLDEPQAAEISTYLKTHAGSGSAVDAKGRPILRITDTRWFRHEHDEVSAATWRKPSVKRPANCAACHRRADRGDYGEEGIRLP